LKHPSGSFVPFTIVAGSSTDKNMQENSAHVEAPKIRFDSPLFLPLERVKAGITEIALALIVFAALVAFCCFH
jgi:hypothetical protein